MKKEELKQEIKKRMMFNDDFDVMTLANILVEYVKDNFEGKYVVFSTGGGCVRVTKDEKDTENV